MSTATPLPLRILITGGGGLIGSHLAAALHQHDAYEVHIADQKRTESTSQLAVCSRFWTCDLRDRNACDKLVRTIKPDVVFHLAANMGGMGFIHGNQSEISSENTCMTLNLGTTMKAVGCVKLVLFASTACVYNHARQGSDSKDESLSETRDVYPQERKDGDAYARSKLFEEEYLFTLQSEGCFKVLVVRYHNVYGRGTWHGGREKLPMAVLRKAIVAEGSLELWGSGEESRSYIYVDDAVNATIQLFHLLLAAEPSSDVATHFHSHGINIGSNTPITTQEAAHIVLGIAGKQGCAVTFANQDARIRGVAKRNSDNTKINEFLPSFSPRSFAEGLAEVFPWLKQRVEHAIAVGGYTPAEFATSVVVDHERRREPPSWGLLLPIRPGPEALANYKQFLDSLRSTASEAIHTESLRLFIGLDTKDGAEAYVQAAVAVGIPQQLVYLVAFDYGDPSAPNFVPKRGAICSYWRILAQDAFQSGCTFTALMGDDVVLLSPHWPRAMEAAFQSISTEKQVPYGFGCVCFEDKSFPGFPTFPVIGKVHYDMFPDVLHHRFKNQDADPWLYQLYRRFGAQRYLKGVQLRNTIGGAMDARYEKQHIDWSTDLLDDATTTVRTWLRGRGYRSAAVGVTTLDVVVPTFRCIVSLLSDIVRLKDHVDQHQASVQVIVICDNPQEATSMDRLEAAFLGDPDVRIRTNAKNLGASATRNRGLAESAAEYVLFIDDDVTIPDPALVMRYLDCIQQWPDACGFAGLSRFPQPPNARCRGMHLSGATFFWTIARVLGTGKPAPWAVTANVCLKRHRNVRFDESYPKTGGGEDIAFCNETRKAFDGAPILCAPLAVVEHPYWNNGHPPLSRFFGWAYGDGLLNDRYRGTHTYRSAWDCSEFCLFVVPAAAVAMQLILCAYGRGWSPVVLVLQVALHVAVAHVVRYVHTLYGLLLATPPDDGPYDNAGRPTGCLHLMACAFWSTCIGTATELGRLYGHWNRGMLLRNIGVRYMWWGPENLSIVPGEQARQQTRFRVIAAVSTVVVACLGNMLGLV